MSARVRRGTVRALCAGLVAAALLAACTPSSEPSAAPAPTGEVEVFTWWASGSEKLAMDVLVQAFREQNPQTTFVDGAVAGGAGSAAKDVLASRLANGDPPDTFLVSGGAELAAHVADGDVATVTALVAELGLADALTPEVADAVSVDGVPYAVPSNLHRANLLWANPAVLTAVGLDPTATYETLDDWLDALAAVRAAGVLPLSLGSPWTQVHLLEVVLISRLGPDGYAGLWDGTTDASSPAVATAVGDFARLLGYTNADRDSLDWNDQALAVVEGEAAFTVMGDWARPVLGPPIRWAPFPGTVGTWDLVVDAFALPVDASSPAATDAWLRTVADPSVQAAFANVKGAVPARADVPQSELGTYQRFAVADLRTATVVPSLALGSAVEPDALAAITDVVGRLTRGTASAAQVQAALAAAAPAG
jgi:glucose/mannose transport system substrate-binding protein